MATPVAAPLRQAVAAVTVAVGGIGAWSSCNPILGIERATLGDGGTGDAGADPLTCDNYCGLMAKNCSGQNLEYLSDDVCHRLCGYLDKGEFYPPQSEPDHVDTLGCRLFYAAGAATEPAAQCRRAGPLGSTSCGGPCRPFCNLEWRYCTDDNGFAIYPGQIAGCEGICNGNVDAGGDSGGYAYVLDGGDLVDPRGTMIETGDTLNCRMWHVEYGIVTNLPAVHCPHTAQVSTTCR